MIIDTRCSVPNIECRCTKMNLCSPSVIKNLCKELDIRPTKSKGQNFLIDGNILNKIVQAADLKKTDTVLEVGPGLGCLTMELAKRAGKVISVELDRKLAAYLREMIQEYNNVEIVEGDILKLGVRGPANRAGRQGSGTAYSLFPVGYKIVANLPYNITSRFLRKFLTAENKPSEMVLMIQKEVAQRICAKAGDMSLLAVSVQYYGQPKIVDYVSKNCFWPSPEVDSAILRVKLRDNHKLPIGEAYPTPIGEASKPRQQQSRGAEASPKKVGVLANQQDDKENAKHNQQEGRPGVAALMRRARHPLVRFSHPLPPSR